MNRSRRRTASLVATEFVLVGALGVAAPAGASTPAPSGAVGASSAVAGTDATSVTTGTSTGTAATTDWDWPLEHARVIEPFRAPSHAYGAGHRGVDLMSPDSQTVRAPADGEVVFVGPVAGRGVITIDHGAGLVSTLEPVDPAVIAGQAVVAGDAIAAVGSGGHSVPGALHFGVRSHGVYINPLLLLGGVPRAVLLPCC